MNQANSVRAWSPDGFPLRLLRWGQAGPALSLLHGFGDGAHIWSDVAPRLAAGFRVHALDLRGHGESGWAPDGRYAARDHCRDLEAALDMLGIEQTVLIGHSLGGYVATLFAARYPARVSRLAILDIGPDVDHTAATQVRQQVASRPARYATCEAYADHLRSSYILASDKQLADIARASLRPLAEGGYALKLDPALRVRPPPPQQDFSQSFRQALVDVECPTLVLRGEASAILRRNVAVGMVTHWLRRATLATVPRAGHALLIDNPSHVAESLARFVADVAGPTDNGSPQVCRPPGAEGAP
ncbi:MAG: alpha/beta hydrolase [Myxococcales bacterium]|nr:alpha/beta hydrolase [Myxococcales bacterium]MDD9965769.1 alpha/beta hydrolase [Myxococcales bacterium]